MGSGLLNIIGVVLRLRDDFGSHPNSGTRILRSPPPDTLLKNPVSVAACEDIHFRAFKCPNLECQSGALPIESTTL